MTVPEFASPYALTLHGEICETLSDQFVCCTRTLWMRHCEGPQACERISTAFWERGPKCLSGELLNHMNHL